MSESLQLLFPCCSTRSIESGNAQKNEKRFTSASAHLATAVALAIIVGTAAALAVYFLHNGVIKWTALAGGGGALVSGTAIYTMLRCACGTLPQKRQTISFGNRNLNLQPVYKESDNHTLLERDPGLVHSKFEEPPHVHVTSDKYCGFDNVNTSPAKEQIEANAKAREEKTASDNREILSSCDMELMEGIEEIPANKSVTLVHVDQDTSLSSKEKIELLEEKLKSHDLYFASDEAYCKIKYVPPSKELPYSHYVIPIRVDDCIFEVEMFSLGVTKQRAQDKWEELFSFRYLGKRFEAYGTSYFHLEKIWYGHDTFSPPCFKVAYQQWLEGFEKWNRNQQIQQKYLTYFDLIAFARDEMHDGILDIHPLKTTFSFGGGEGTDPEETIWEYYIPDYDGYQFEKDKQVLLITRSQASPLVDVECIDYISDALYAKMHAQTCRIPLKEGLDCYDIEYRADTKMLVIRGKIRS